MTKSTLVLIHGIYTLNREAIKKTDSLARTASFKEASDELGIEGYEWINGHTKPLVNKFLRMMRDTDRAVDALEIVEFEERALRAALADKDLRSRVQTLTKTSADDFDINRSFILMGSYRQLVDGPKDGQRVLWLGRGLDHLSDSEFIAHYVNQHGPLVAGHAESIGLRRYRQVASEQAQLCGELHNLGFGRAPGPGVFGELVAGPPPLKLTALRTRRQATREIEADEKRHIDFARSMLLLT